MISVSFELEEVESGMLTPVIMAVARFLCVGAGGGGGSA